MKRKYERNRDLRRCDYTRKIKMKLKWQIQIMKTNYGKNSFVIPVPFIKKEACVGNKKMKG